MNEFSIIILILGVLCFVVGIIMLICSLFIKNNSKIIKKALWAMLVGALMAIGGFTLCTATLDFHV